MGPPQNHGGPPGHFQRHTGDLGNVSLHEMNDKVYVLENVSVQDLWGRSVIVHEDPDDYGLGP